MRYVSVVKYKLFEIWVFSKILRSIMPCRGRRMWEDRAPESSQFWHFRVIYFLQKILYFQNWTNESFYFNLKYYFWGVLSIGLLFRSFRGRQPSKNPSCSRAGGKFWVGSFGFWTWGPLTGWVRCWRWPKIRDYCATWCSTLPWLWARWRSKSYLAWKNWSEIR